MKFSSIKSVVLAVLCMSVYTTTILGQSKDKDKDKNHKNVSVTTLNGNPDVSSGRYQAERQYGGIYIGLMNEDIARKLEYSIQFRVEENEIRTTSNGFSVVREAGVLEFEGTLSGSRGEGAYAFKPNSEFKRFLRNKGITAEKNEEYYYFKLFLGDVTQQYTNKVLSLGYQPSMNELAKLGIHEVSTEYLEYANQSDFQNLDLSMITKWAIHGVSKEYLEGLDRLGYGSIDANDVKKFAIHGVTLKYIDGLKKAGYNMEPGYIRKFAIHGITLKYIDGLDKIGYGGMEPGMVQKFAIHGLSLNYISDLLASDISRPEPNTLKKAAVHGVTANFISRARRGGHDSNDLNDYIKWKIRGI